MLLQYSDMKAAIFFILFFGFFIFDAYAQDSELRTPITLDEEDVIISDEDMTILFSISIAVVIGLFVYAARGAILRKKQSMIKKIMDQKKTKTMKNIIQIGQVMILILAQKLKKMQNLEKQHINQHSQITMQF